MNDEPKKQKMVIVSGILMLIAAAFAIAIASHNSTRPLHLLDPPTVTPSAKARIRSVECKSEPSDHEVIPVSAAVAIICGNSPATADRYEARNDALRSIARNCKLSQSDLSAPLAYIALTNDILRVDPNCFSRINEYVRNAYNECSGHPEPF